jgi:DNA/RNA-binding domain of Phe-tRNA-synthetase-like protein
VITPTWRASYRCFTAKPTEGYPRGGQLYARYRQDQELKSARNRKI